jgi:hypothetical protein
VRARRVPPRSSLPGPDVQRRSAWKRHLRQQVRKHHARRRRPQPGYVPGEPPPRSVLPRARGRPRVLDRGPVNDGKVRSVARRGGSCSTGGARRSGWRSSSRRCSCGARGARRYRARCPPCRRVASVPTTRVRSIAHTRSASRRGRLRRVGSSVRSGAGSFEQDLEDGGSSHRDGP